MVSARGTHKRELRKQFEPPVYIGRIPSSEEDVLAAAEMKVDERGRGEAEMCRTCTSHRSSIRRSQLGERHAAREGKTELRNSN